MVPRIQIPASDEDVELFYPESDGEPLGETGIHSAVTGELYLILKHWFSRDPSVLVGMDNLVYYVPGDTRTFVSPDIYVVKDVGNQPRRVYKTWEEGRGLDVVFEISSRQTHRVDLTKKREIYQDALGVAEYFIYDPTGDYLADRLCGWRRGERGFENVPVVDGRVTSQTLGLGFGMDGYYLRPIDPATGQFVPNIQELAAAWHEAETRVGTEQAAREREAAAREREAAARRKAEQALARLRAENERLKKRVSKPRRR